MSDEVNIHASCVAIGARGVLLLGPSAAGKSDLALRLIDGGARLVSDDRTLVYVRGGVLQATSPASIRGLLEIRGVGIVTLQVRVSVTIALVVRLGKEGARFPAKRAWQPPAPLKSTVLPPQIALNGHFASTPAKIRAALAAFSRGLFRDTFNPT